MKTDSDHKPVFIIGSGRSGTSVLTWCLGQHPNILHLPETNWIARLALQMPGIYRAGSVNGLYSHLGALDWDEGAFYAAFGDMLDGFIVQTREPRMRFIRKVAAHKYGVSEEEILRREKEGTLGLKPDGITSKNYQVVRSASDPKRRWVDGTPLNTHYVYGLSQLFPGAKFIHLLRNPHAVAKSFMGFSQAGGAGKDYREADAYATWRQAVEAAVEAEKALGGERVLRLYHEELVEVPEAALRRCFGFLGEEFTADCLLPLKDKINSSYKEVGEAEQVPATREGKEADVYYAALRAAPPGVPDAAVLEGMRQRFTQDAGDVLVQAQGGWQVVKALVRSLRRRFGKG